MFTPKLEHTLYSEEAVTIGVCMAAHNNDAIMPLIRKLLSYCPVHFRPTVILRITLQDYDGADDDDDDDDNGGEDDDAEDDHDDDNGAI